MNRVTKFILQLAFLASIAGFALVASGCPSDADTASDNISKDAEQFKVARRIVGVNGITDKVEFEVTGRCSVEGSTNMGNLRMMEVTCAEGPKIKGKQPVSKHFLGVSDNTIPIVTQIDPHVVSTQHSKVILKPSSIIPDLDLVTGESEAQAPSATPTPSPTP